MFAVEHTRINNFEMEETIILIPDVPPCMA